MSEDEEDQFGEVVCLRCGLVYEGDLGAFKFCDECFDHLQDEGFVDEDFEDYQRTLEEKYNE